MTCVLLVSKNPLALSLLGAKLKQDNANDVNWVSSGQEALALVAKGEIDVVIVAEELTEGDGLTFVKELTYKHPLINCALVSPLPPDEFHETTEGLGIFMQLPANPGATEAGRLMSLLESINALLAG